jgi:sugar phosphate isomerase/epimerase
VVEITRIHDGGARREVRAIAEQAGLELVYAAQPVILADKLDPNSLDADARRRAVEALKAEIELAYQMRAIGFAFMSGGDPGPAQRPAAVAAFVRSCQELCEHAAGLGAMPVLVESFDRDVDKRALVGPNALAAEIAATVARDNFGLLVDLSHLPLQGEPIEEALAAVRAHLRHAHMGNCLLGRPGDPAWGDQHLRFGYPNSEIGVPQLKAYLQGLLQIGYLSPARRPVLSFEVKPMPGESTLAVIANAKRTLRQAWLEV